MKIGLITDCTKLPLEQAIVKAAQLGVNGVQIYATTGVFSPDMTPDERKRYKKLIESNGLVVSALCGDMGGTHFEKEENNALKVEKTKRIVDLAEYFDTNVVTTHIGSIPDDVNCKKYSVMLKAIAEAGDYDVFLLSATPKLYFTGVTYTQMATGHSMDYPLMNAGKAITRGDKLYMPIALTVSHAFVDGEHISQFFEKVQAFLNEIHL